MRSKLAARTARAQQLGYQITEDGKALNPSGMVLRCCLSNKGYLKFSIPRAPGDSDKTVFVHQLAALQWYGPKALQPGIQVRHLDKVRVNCARTNLALGTNTINQMDIDPVTRRERATRASRAAVAKTRKFSPEEVRIIREAHRGGESIKHLARRLQVSHATVSYIVNRRTYADVT